MKIELNNTEIELVIVRKKIKNIYFRVKEDLRLYVTVHPLVTQKEIIKLIEDNNASIYKMYEKMCQKLKYENDFYFLGDKYDIIIDENIKRVEIVGDKIYTPNQVALDKFITTETLKLFSKRVEQILVQFPDVPKFQLKIRSMKSRWGVCNRGNNTITLNKELIRKDVSLLDYVIIHELCHFKHPNHSSAFWHEVAKFYPNYKLARKQLKEV